MLSSVIISHSKLSCNDESATLDEQAEKILYYYPESTSVAEQLTQIGCLESLVQFSNTFSNKSNNIDYVLLKNSIWGFLECEENLWIYINIKHPSNSGSEVPSKSASTSASQDAFSNHALHIPNGDVLIDIITKLYRMYMTFHGSINSILFSNIGSWNEILRARDLRKRSRKLQYQMDQLDDDLRYLKRLEERKNRPPSVVEPSGTTNDDDDDDILPIRTHSKASDKNETLSYFEGKKSVDMEVELSKVSDAADICRSELVSLLNSGLYSPDIARQSLLTFMRWYLSRGELVNATFLHQCHGMNNTAVSKEMLPHVMRIRNGLVSLSDSIQGSVIILDGQLLWSDLDADTTFLLYEYARLVDMERLRSSLLALSGGNDASVSGVSGTTLGTIDYEKWMSAFERQSGFLTSSLDIMVGSGAGSANWNVGWVNASQLNERTSTHCLWSPLLYVINTMSVELSASEVTGTTQSDTLSDVPSSAAWSARSSGSRNQYSSAYKGFSMESQLSLGNTSALARVVCYRQGRFVMLMLLDESLNGPYQQHESLPTNPQKDSLSTRSQSRHSDGYPMVGRVENKLLRGEYSGMIPFPLEHNSSSNSCSDDEVNATQKKIQAICSKVQTLLQPLISNLLTIAGNSNDAYINSSRVQPTINSNSNSINRLQTSGLPTSQPTASPSSAATTSKTSPRGSTGSTTLISPRGGAKLNRNVRLVYNNTINRAVKSNVYKGGFEVGLLWPQMLPSSSAISSNGNNNTASVKGNLANKGSGSGNRTGEVLPVGTPRNGVKTAQRSPPQNTRVPLLNSSSQSTLSTSSATAGGSPYLHNELPRWLIRQLKNQYAIPASFLTGSLEPNVVMALNAACASLSGQNGAPLLESCVRVCSRPGEEKWVLAKRLHGRFLFFVFDGCPTVVDMLDYVRGTVEGPLSNIYYY